MRKIVQRLISNYLKNPRMNYKWKKLLMIKYNKITINFKNKKHFRRNRMKMIYQFMIIIIEIET